MYICSWIEQNDYMIKKGTEMKNVFQDSRMKLHPDVSLRLGCQFDRKRHGGLFDRGSADSYYHRPRSPHWWPHGTGRGEMITDLTPSERAEYLAGYEYNEKNGDKKDWG